MIKSAYRSRLLASMAVAVALALPAGSALAAAASIGDFVGKTAAEIAATLEQQGYKVGEIEMEDGNLPAKQQQPDQIEDDPQTTVCVWAFDDFFSEGCETCQSQLEGLDAKGDTDDGQA